MTLYQRIALAATRAAVNRCRAEFGQEADRALLRCYVARYLALADVPTRHIGKEITGDWPPHTLAVLLDGAVLLLDGSEPATVTLRECVSPPPLVGAV